MKILFLSPQPFYQERGTAIAIDLLLKSLSERGDSIDLLTFNVGDDRVYPNVSISRIAPPFAPKSIKPGFSVKKIYCDLFLFFDAIKLIRKNDYDVIHAVEEASFIAMLLGRIYRIPFVFDMDSSMATQMLDSFSWLRPFARFLHWLESLPMRRAIAVVPMCEDLAVKARRYCDGIVYVLKDVSLIGDNTGSSSEDLRAHLNGNGPMLLYVGNLEEYQGIDLLLDGFAVLAKTNDTAELVIIGGKDQDIEKYRNRAQALEIDDRVHLIGPRPVENLGDYLGQGDLLISPRTHGTNTPMKVYSYLDSGVAVVATALATHTQVMTENEAALVQPNPEALAAKIEFLLENDTERSRLADNARDLVRREHSWAAFQRRVDELFGELDATISQVN
jgi:glycosyltransferase involved in cell wall biosynthesis